MHLNYDWLKRVRTSKIRGFTKLVHTAYSMTNRKTARVNKINFGSALFKFCCVQKVREQPKSWNMADISTEDLLSE